LSCLTEFIRIVGRHFLFMATRLLRNTMLKGAGRDTGAAEINVACRCPWPTSVSGENHPDRTKRD
jgi:hypothetical protein